MGREIRTYTVHYIIYVIASGVYYTTINNNNENKNRDNNKKPYLNSIYFIRHNKVLYVVTVLLYSKFQCHLVCWACLDFDRENTKLGFI